MKWSWKLGTIAGIGVFVHATFLLLIGWVVMVYALQGHGTWEILEGVLLVLLAFACVVAHEFGHALTARRYGIKTKDITLLPIGGLARLEKMPDDPWEELWVALAGPAVNVVIAASLYLGLTLSGHWQTLTPEVIEHGGLAQRLVLINVVLVVFNMIPAFPMDGGRVARALLATRLDYAKATRLAASLGQGMALLLGFLGLAAGNPWLIFIAFFVWIGAAQEASYVELRSALEGLLVRRAMITEFRTLEASDPLSKAVEYLLAGSQHDFPVLEDGQVAGILTRDDLVSALAQGGLDAPAATRMHRKFETVSPGDELDSVVGRLQGSATRAFPVLDAGRLVGMLTWENISELIMVRSALGLKGAAVNP